MTKTNPKIAEALRTGVWLDIPLTPDPTSNILDTMREAACRLLKETGLIVRIVQDDDGYYVEVRGLTHTIQPALERRGFTHVKPPDPFWLKYWYGVGETGLFQAIEEAVKLIREILAGEKDNGASDEGRS